MASPAKNKPHDDQAEPGLVFSPDSADDEISETSSVGDDQQFKAYWTRWYILGIHTLIGLAQVLVYTTWGPIENSASRAFGFTQTDLALLPNWYNTCYLITVVPFMWLIQHRGLRSAEITTAGLVAFGSAARCLTFDTQFSDRIFIHLGQIINGMAAPIPWLGCTCISAYWFPLKERPLATSIGLASTLLGLASSFIVGPNLVDYFAKMAPEDPVILREAIRKLLYFEAFFAQLVLVLAVIYLPSNPPTPPSFTASVERVPFFRAVRQLLRHRQVWICMFVYAVSSGVYNSWHQVLTAFVSPAMSEVDAGWVGFAICVTGILAAPTLLLAAKDLIDRHPKTVCTALMAVGSAFVGVMVMTAFFFPQFFTPPLIWVALVVSAGCYTAAEPLWWEMGVEVSYPIPESVVSGLFSMASCLVSWVYFVFYMFPQLGTDWATWSLLVAEILVIPVFLLFKPIKNRTLEDQRNSTKTSVIINDLEMIDLNTL